MEPVVTSQSECEHILGLLTVHRRNLQILERQIAAQGGENSAPVHLITQARDARTQIAELERQYITLGCKPEKELLPPYPGLLAFDETQSHLFHGRSAECAELLEKMHA